MRHMKLFGLTAVAAVVAMAFVGVGSAMATGSSALCKVNETPCAAGNLTGAVHFISVGEPLLQTALPKLHVLCLSSLIVGTAEALGNPTGITVTAFTWEGCYTLPKGATHNCEINTIALGLIDVLRMGVNVGEATTLGTEILVKCGEIIHCIYGGAQVGGLEFEGALKVAATGHGMIRANANVLPRVGGILCPGGVTTWTALYEPLEHIYVST